MRRAARLLALLAIAAFAGLTCQAALGYWSGSGEVGTGTGIAAATTVDQGAVPRVREIGSTSVVVRWGAGTLVNLVPVTGYIVKRYNQSTGAVATIGSGCAGTITALTCTEAEMPVGDWEYTVTPTLGSNWRGLESVKSGGVNTGPGTMTLSRTVFGGTVAPLPAVATGTVSGFGANEAISFSLDDGAPLTSSPAQVGAEGTASFSVTVPAGTPDGPHSLIVDSSATDASAGIVVDNTAPTIKLTVNPAPNAGGWNNTSPVEVTGEVSDGNGSGVALARYTTDGSNPKTSPTVQTVVGGSVMLISTTTLKAYLTDTAGNESAVETLQVNIDTIPPNFTVGYTNVQGGFYQTPGNIETGEPGVGYYRGQEAGSVQFVINPTSIGGSPAVSAGFSALPAEAVGFSLDSSSVTTPAGGPFVSNPLSWVAGTTSVASGTISLTDQAGNTVGGPGTLRNDSTPPIGGSVEAGGLVGSGGRYSASLTLKLNLAKGADAASGLADGTGPNDAPAKLMRASAPLTSSNGVGDGTCGSYSAFAQVGGDDPAAVVSDTVPTDNTCYRYQFLVSDHVGNIAAYESGEIKVQTTAAASLRPTNAVLTPVTGVDAQFVSGSTVFYNPAQLGSFNVESSASAPYAGIAQMSFPAIAGFSGGGAVTSPTSGTIFRSTYSWSANASSPSPGVEALAATNNLGLSSTNEAAFSVVKDATGPSGGSVDATGLVGTGGRYSTSLTVNLAFAPGTDSGAGLVASGAQLLRASASLTSVGNANGACGTFGAYTQVGTNDPTTPKSDIVPVDRTCYRYEYVVSDKVGNETIYTSPDVKVDTAAPPAPTLSFSALTNAFWSGTGTVVYYRPGATSGGFQVSAASGDTAAGTSAYGFPVLPSGWTSAAAGSVAETYSWSAANPTAPSGAQSVTATNNAGRSSTTTFTATPDSAAPAGGSVSYANGSTTATTASVTVVAATDSGSEVSAALLQRASAVVSGGSCGTFGAFTTVATNPASPISDPVTSGNCYQYRYLVTDNVGNQAIFASAAVLKVETALTNSLTMTSPVGAYLNAGNLYYNSNSAGSFSLRDAVAGGAGPASATYPTVGSSGWTHPTETVTTPAGGPYASSSYSWVAHPSSPGTYTVTGKDTLGASVATALTFVSDQSPPSGGNILYTNGYSIGSTVSISFGKGTDAGSGLNPASGTIEVSTATLAGGACGAFSSYSIAVVEPASGVSLPVTSGTCYRYRYLISDNVGNQTTYTSASVTKVDTVAPVDSLSLESTVNASLTGGTVFYRGDVAGSFKVLDAAVDTASGQVSATFPAIATTGWIHNLETITTPSAGPYLSTTFSWTANPSNPATKSVFSTDAAGKSSTAASLAFVADTVPPSGGSVTYLNGTVKTLSVPVTTADGTDSLSGVNPALDILKRDETTLNTTTGVCGTFPATFGTTVTRVGGADTSVTSGHCYQYRYLVTDKVGNQATYTPATVVKVDTTGPVVTAISSLQSNGSTGNGKLEVGDKLILTFNQPLAAASVPTSFSGATEVSPGSGQNVTLAIPGISQGTLGTGSPGYIAVASTTATFGGTAALVNNGTATTVSLAVTSLSGAATAASSGALAFRPAISITEASGIPASGTFTTSSIFKLF